MFQQAIIASSRVFKLLDEDELSPAQNVENLSKGTIIEGKITFDNVSFSYDGQRDVLKNISFTASQGETVALVGHTGSGKSSIINLLMRFYEFERGNILIDGQNIKSYPVEELREKMGLVLQDPFLFFGTIRDNIKLHSEEMTDREVEGAATFVQANTFIEKLPEAYGHPVVERGSTFSSGQRQLIAFARTIATRPKILVLDEATANIDTETEEAIQEALSRMRKGRTTIAIAHRLSTIQDADLILVGKRGEAADFAKLHLGSNLERVVRTSTRPVLVASRAFQPVKRFLVAFDGGPSVMKAINHIATGKLFPGLEGHMVTVGKDTPESRGKLETAANVLRSAGYTIHTHIEEGEPEKIIASHAEADHIDLLVMGAYGHSRIRSFIIGSTTAEMVRSVKRPVMLFR